MNLRDSLTYEPVELGFGTSGLRGLVVDMTDLECYINTLGFLDFLQQQCYQAGSEIILAGDLRTSTPRIMSAVMQAITERGYTPVNCGLVPTPTAALYAYQQSKPCVMVTGSHIPADRNGIKYYKPSGEVLKADETAIKACVAQAREGVYASEAGALFNEEGALVNPPELPSADAQASANYKARYADFFAPNGLAGKKIVLYQHSAVGRDIIADILMAHGAEVVAVDRSDSFVPIDTENVTEAEKAQFKGYAETYPDVFAIVSTDGDSDRPFVIDENGEFYRGDILGCIVADYLGAGFAALPISSNDAADEFLKSNDVPFVHTRIGSPYVIVAMDEAEADGPRVGWEVNGGFLVGSEITKEGKVLPPLPTRDAVLPILCALYAAAEANTTVSQLFKRLPERFTGGGLLDDVPMDKIKSFLQVCDDTAKTQALMDTVFDGSNLGEVTNLDLTDGLRVRLASGNVIHFRPSGNAPQFRVYTNAGSQEEADSLVAQSLADDGYIQKILQNV